jgi:STE24 endopeptidase
VLVALLGWILTAPAGGAVVQAQPGFDVDAATRDYLAQMSPAEKQRSDAYFEGGYWLQLWNFLLGAGIALLLLQTRLSARMRDWARKLTRFSPLQTAAYGLQYVVLTAVLTFPLTVYSDFFREHQYHLATQGFGGWFVDWLKGVLVTVVFLCPLLMVLMGAVRRLSRSWHVWGALIALCFVVLFALIAPVFIAPLFNRYSLLSEPKVVEPVLRIARANGIDAKAVYQVDASRQSKRVSANVSGLLGTMRITLNDNLLNRCSLLEIEAVMGHEMGHYVLNHVYKMVLFLSVVIVVGFTLLRWSLDGLLPRVGPRWGIAGMGDVAVLPLVVLLFSSYTFVLTPVLNSFIRTQEMEADMFGLNAARQPDGAAEVALKLGEYRKMNPGPLEELVFFDHPSGATRIRTAMRWKAENLSAGLEGGTQH